MSMRLFAAMALPDPVCAELQRLQKGVAGARWRPRENFHITLRFFGEMDERRAEDLDAELATISAPVMALTLGGPDWFGKRDPHTLWMGVAANPALEKLQRDCERAARRTGLAAETRNYKPHVTLAYLKDSPLDRLQRFCERNARFKAADLPMTYFSLYRSWPRRGEANIYEPIADYPLG